MYLGGDAPDHRRERKVTGDFAWHSPASFDLNPVPISIPVLRIYMQFWLGRWSLPQGVWREEIRVDDVGFYSTYHLRDIRSGQPVTFVVIAERAPPKPPQNVRPVAFRKFLESEEVPQGLPSVFQILHPDVGARLWGLSQGRAAEDHGLSSGALAQDDSFAQGCRDWDEIECWTSVGHCDARDCHCIQGIEVTISAHVVVHLKDCNSSRDDPTLCVNPVGESVVGGKRQEDEV